MDPVIDLVLRIGEKLDLDVFLIIIGFVEKHHIELGRNKWKENIAKVHEEYKRSITISWRNPGSDTPWNDFIQKLSLVSWQNHTNPEEFDHDYSCRSFNHRDMDLSCHNTKEVRTRIVDKHWRPLIIANAMKAKSTFIFVPQNYYYQKLYVD